MGKTLIVVGDCHVGSTHAIWPEGGTVAGGGTVALNAPQQWLWTHWLQMLDTIGRLPQRPILVLNGDLLQGRNAKDGALVSNNIACQTAAALRLLEPLVLLCERVYCVRGSEWHGGRCDEDVERLAERLEAVPDPQTGEYSRDHLWLDLDGAVVHVKHQISVTSLLQSEATAPMRDLANALVALVMAYGTDAPNLRAIVRSHRHRALCLEKNGRWALTVPSWQWPGPYVAQRMPLAMAEFGYGVLHAEGGQLACQVCTYPLPPLRPEVI